MIEGTQLPSPSGGDGTVSRGQQLGKYEVIERLATGGMAEIFLARASGLLGFQKLVVIKRILPHLASRNDFIQMFLDEARIATTLSHPNIVQTYEVGVHGKSYFLVMEYLAGEDVRAIQRRLSKAGRRMPIEHALNIAIGVAAGLQYAHDKRDFDGKPLDIVHRDVTPQNIIVSYEGGVKLLDFGIAKASNRINETRSGSFKGKIPYMSPEQCRGEALDRRTDLFSLGILLYEMTLHRRLFRGDTDFQILKQIAEGNIPRPRQLEPGYDPRLEAIVMKALEMDPRRRYQNAREMQLELEQLAYELRMRLSPLQLADFMQALFSEKVGAWHKAAEGDAGELEQHVQTVARQREEDVQAEEAEAQAPPPAPRLDALPARLDALPARLDALSARFDALPARLDALPHEPAFEPGLESALEPAVLTPVRPSRRRAWWAAPAVLGVLGLSLLVWRLTTRTQAIAAPPSGGATQPATAVTAATAATAATPAAKTSAPRELPSPGMAAAAPAPDESEEGAAVQVSTTPPGATLILDGRTLTERSPARLTGLPAGRPHVLTVRLPGYVGVAQRFALEAGEEASLELELKKTGGPGTATVKRGSGKPGARPIDAARSTSARAPLRGSAHGVPAPPEPAAAPAAPRADGALVVASSPWCNVSVDGQARGATPLKLTLKAGPHEVVLVNPEFHIRRTLSVEIEPGQTLRKTLDFAPE